MIRPLSSADISISPPEISNFFISRNTDIDLISDTDIVSNSFNFLWVFKGCFNKHGSNSDDINKISDSRPS